MGASPWYAQGEKVQKRYRWSGDTPRKEILVESAVGGGLLAFCGRPAHELRGKSVGIQV